MKEAGIIGKLRRDRDSRVIAFYFLAAFVFGLILIRGYGVYWEPDYFKIPSVTTSLMINNGICMISTW